MSGEGEVDAKRLLQGLNADHFTDSPHPEPAQDSWELGADLKSLRPSRRFEAGALVGGQFEVLSVLGRGAMGRVLEARDTATGREVALKLILSGRETNQLRARLQREAELTARIQHPGIPKIHGVGDHAGLPFVIYEKIVGARSAAKVYPELGREARLDLLEAVAEAMAAAHAAGVVHRDLKPENVLVDAHGRAYVVDFGLAFDPQSVERMTQTGALLGSPLYMAPEQVAGHRDDTGPASDVWALGVILYELLCDQAPFLADSLPVLSAQICSAQPTPFRETASEAVPRALASVCFKALEKAPEDRYPDANAFLNALVEARERGPARRAPLAFAFGLALVAALGVVAAVLAPRRSPPSPQPATETQQGASPPLPADSRTPPRATPDSALPAVTLPWERNFHVVTGVGFADENTIVVAGDTSLALIDLRRPDETERAYPGGSGWKLRHGVFVGTTGVRLPSPDYRSAQLVYPEPVDEAQVSPSRRWLATSVGTRLRVTPVGSPSVVKLEAEHDERIEGLELDDQHVVAFGRDALSWWNLETGQRLSGAKVRPESAALDPDGESLYVGNTDGALMRLHLSDGALLKPFARANTAGVSVFATGAHRSRIARVHVLAGGATILTVSRSSGVARSNALWSRDGTELWRSEPKPYGFELLAISPSGERAVVGCRETKTVRVFDLRLEELVPR